MGRDAGAAAPRARRRPGPLDARLTADMRGVSEETTTGVHRLYVMAEQGTLLFPAINVNDSVTKSKFDNIYGCRHSLTDGLCRATDVMLGGKSAVVLRLRRGRQGLRAGAARPGRAREHHRDRPDLRAAGRHGGLRGRPLEDVVETADIFITATGNSDVITAEHMARMKDKAIVGNIGHFDNEIDMAGLKKVAGHHAHPDQAAVRRVALPRRPLGDDPRRGAPAEPRLRHRPPVLRDVGARSPTRCSRRSSCTQRAEEYEKKVYMLPKELDEEVARLHLDHLGVKLTELTDEQADVPRRAARGPLQARPLPLLDRLGPAAALRQAAAGARRQNGGSGAGPTIVSTMCAVFDVIRNSVLRSAPPPQHRLPQTSGVSTTPMRSPSGVEHPEAAGPGRPDVAELVALHAVAVARARPADTDALLDQRARAERAVRGDVEDLHRRLRVVDVEQRLVGREAEAIRWSNSSSATTSSISPSPGGTRKSAL